MKHPLSSQTWFRTLAATVAFTWLGFTASADTTFNFTITDPDGISPTNYSGTGSFTIAANPDASLSDQPFTVTQFDLTLNADAPVTFSIGNLTPDSTVNITTDENSQITGFSLTANNGTYTLTSTGGTAALSLNDDPQNPGNPLSITTGLSVSAIPEPATYAAIMSACILGAVATHRRFKKKEPAAA